MKGSKRKDEMIRGISVYVRFQLDAFLRMTVRCYGQTCKSVVQTLTELFLENLCYTITVRNMSQPLVPLSRLRCIKARQWRGNVFTSDFRIVPKSSSFHPLHFHATSYQHPIRRAQFTTSHPHRITSDITYTIAFRSIEPKGKISIPT